MNLPLFAVYRILAGIVVVTGVASWLADLSAGQMAGIVAALAVAVVLAGAAWLIVGLLGQHGAMLLRIEVMEARLADPVPTPPERDFVGLPAGIVAPTFALPDLSGTPMTLDALREAGRHVVLLFIDPDCDACAAMLPSIAEWQRVHAGTLTLAVVSRGTAAENRAEFGDHAIAPVLMQAHREVARAYRADVTPSAVVVMADGRIGSPVVAGPDEIGQLVQSVADAAAGASAGRDAAQPPAVLVGEPAPAPATARNDTHTASTSRNGRATTSAGHAGAVSTG